MCLFPTFPSADTATWNSNTYFNHVLLRANHLLCAWIVSVCAYQKLMVHVHWLAMWWCVLCIWWCGRVGEVGRLVWETLQLLSRISHCVEFHTQLMTWCHMQYVADTLIQSLIICTWKGQQICWLELPLNKRTIVAVWFFSLYNIFFKKRDVATVEFLNVCYEALSWAFSLLPFSILKVKVTREDFANHGFL